MNCIHVLYFICKFESPSNILLEIFYMLFSEHYLTFTCVLYLFSHFIFDNGYESRIIIKYKGYVVIYVS